MFIRALAQKAWLCAVVLTLLLLPAALETAQARTQGKKTQARTEFEKAEQLREQLQSRPQGKRKPSDYTSVIRSYDRALHVGPATSFAPQSIVAAAELYNEMADVFGDRRYAKSAAERYRFLIKEYPKSKFIPEAQRALDELEKTPAARNSGPGSTGQRGEKPREKAGEQAARSAVEKLAQRPVEKAPEKAAEKASDQQAVMDPPVSPAEQRTPGRVAQVTSIHHWATPNYTRVVIEMDAPVEYQAGRITNPDRIFFDLHGARLSSALRHQNISGDDNLLKRVRVAQNQIGITRIVLEVGQVRDYSAFLLPNPYRLVVDINGMRADTRRQQKVAEAKPPASDTGETARAAQKSGRPQGTQAEVQPKQSDSAGDRNAAAGSARSAPRTELAEARREPQAAPPVTTQAPAAQKSPNSAVEKPLKTGDTGAGEPAAEKIDIAKAASASKLGSEPVFERVAPPPPHNTKPAATKESRQAAAAAAAPADARTDMVARPTSTGERSLTRALGLKIGTIVIDAGHGGHDTGTIGPTGLMEKDLVLDVAKRLGSMIADRLGGEVVYTRSDDTFVPLETRTAIANQNQADLFVSIHANSSRDHSARGIETYYLNFTSAQDALEVAARENAVSEKSVHELQDLVKKITLREKLEESREFATEIQRALYTTMSRGNAGLRNRGVKKAPFVVLIGANMPSILAEISFVSNPTDEKLLNRGEYRQKIAEALYRGIQKYANSLSGIKVATHRTFSNP